MPNESILCCQIVFGTLYPSFQDQLTLLRVFNIVLNYTF